MFFPHLVPVLLSLLVGLVLGVVTWSQVRARRQTSGGRGAEAGDDVLVAFMVLAAFGFGAFVTYVLLGTGL
jgi:hypothetical protein